MLRIESVSKKFGGVMAVSNCTFQVKKGTITALIGPNGAGKSTAFNLILGVLNPDSGKVFFKDNDITKIPIFKRARLGISRTFQAVRVFKNLSVMDNLLLVTNNQEDIRSTISFLSFEDKIDTLNVDLSFGQLKLLSLARALLLPHELLMLDEPVAGVNPILRSRFKKIFRDLKEKGETIFLIEHDMDFVMDIADHVIVMDAGQVLAQGSPNEIRNNPEVLEAYLGEQI